jgi:SAM-dependent methyltransferase
MADPVVRKLARCPICTDSNPSVQLQGSQEIRERFQRLVALKYPGTFDGLTDRFSLRVLKCDHCEHFWHEEIPTEPLLSQMYSAAAGRVRAKASTDPNARAYIRAQLQAAARALGKTPVSFLDFGCGKGDWSREARDLGFQVTAFDPSVARSGASRDEEGIRWISDLALIQGERFDLINLNQVLEHVVEPVALLTELRAYCGNSTLLRITVPNLARAGREIWDSFPQGDRTDHLLAPFEHIQGFTRRSFGRLIGNAMLKPLSLRELRSPVSWLRLRYAGTATLARFVPS